MHITIKKILINKFAMPFTALAVISGLAVHDTKLDTLAAFAIALPAAAIASYEGAHMLLMMSDAHTHVERVSVGESAAKTTSLPPWLMRKNDDRYRRNRAGKGNQPFDDYHLPMTV